MRRRALGRFLAALAGAVLFVSGTAQPASAADYNRYLDLIKVGAAFLEQGKDGLSAAELTQFTQDITGALTGVKQDLYAHLDNHAVADIKGQVRYTVEYVQLLNLPTTAPLYVNTVLGAVTNAREKLTVFETDAHRDIVGKALIAEWEPLLIGQAKIGMTPTYGQYQESLEHIIRNVKPTCGEFIDPKLGTVTYSCSFNGRTVTGVQRPAPGGAEHHYGDGNWVRGGLVYSEVSNRTMAETAQDLAKRALADLILNRP